MNAITPLSLRPIQFLTQIAAFLIAICLQIESRVLAEPPGPALSRFKMSPPPKGVTDLKFDDFFVNPIGPTGLEFTAKLQSLRGKRIRLLGYMVHQENKSPATFLLSAIPVQLHDAHYGLADDLPAANVFVLDPANRGKIIRHVSGLVLVSGTLELGSRHEADGRISLIRLTLDSPPNSQKRRPSGKGSTDLLRNSSKS
jgi:hypothetical protein